MKVSYKRMSARHDKMVGDYNNLRKEIFDPAFEQIIKKIASSGYEVKKKKELTFSIYSFIGRNPYIEINFEIGISDNKEGITMWVDMQDEYFKWIEVAEKVISKRITKAEVIKDVSIAFEQAKSLLRTKIKEQEGFDLPLKSLSFSARTLGVLGYGEINTLGELLSWRQNDLRKLRGCGEGTLKEIIRAVSEKGLTLKI